MPLIIQFLWIVPPQDGTDDQPPQQAAKAEGEEPKPKPKPRSGTVDLELDTSLQVEISDALSEQDKVKFTVHTKVSNNSCPLDVKRC